MRLLVLRQFGCSHLLLVFLLSLQVILGEVATLAEPVGVVRLVRMDALRCHLGLTSPRGDHGLTLLHMVLDLLLDLLVKEVRDALGIPGGLHGPNLLVRWRYLPALGLQGFEQE